MRRQMIQWLFHGPKFMDTIYWAWLLVYLSHLLNIETLLGLGLFLLETALYSLCHYGLCVMRQEPRSKPLEGSQTLTSYLEDAPLEKHKLNKGSYWMDEVIT